MFDLPPVPPYTLSNPPLAQALAQVRFPLQAVTVAVKTSALSEHPGLLSSSVRDQDRRSRSVRKAFTLFLGVVSPVPLRAVSLMRSTK